MKARFPRLTYANVVATLALFAALGGAAWAATRLPKNSVGARQLKKSAVSTPKIKDEAVTAAKIRKGTIDGSRLNLASIGTVPSATKATTAGAATTAGDASTLAGAGPATYLGRVAEATTGVSITIAGSTLTDVTPGGPLSISVPAGVGYVVADANASFAVSSTSKNNAQLWVQADDSCSEEHGLGWDSQVYGTLESATTSRVELSQHLAFPVTPGTHSFRLCVGASSSAQLFSRTLTLTTVAKGAGG
jgi:hypothetical protein